jgi:biopolymer transport protein ExbB/TolQ
MIELPLHPVLASGALQFAFEKATMEGKLTIGSLIIVSLFSWTVIFTKGWQLIRARRVAKRFFEDYRSTRTPLDLAQRKVTYDGAPAFELYSAGADELEYQLKNNPVTVHGETRISSTSFTSVKAALERTASEQALFLEKGMIVLSTAVAGGPFIGLLGTVWGVMETFSGIARANSASLTAMAPGVAGALIATVVGLFVAIPAMFAYNFMVTSVRAITQELDAFATEFATAVEHSHVDNRPLGEEIQAANQILVTEIAQANERLVDRLAESLRAAPSR